MTRARKKFDAAFKARIALEALRENATVPGPAKRHRAHPNQIYNWKRQVLDNVAGFFARGAMIDPAKDDLSVRRQCGLLQLPRSGVCGAGPRRIRTIWR